MQRLTISDTSIALSSLHQRSAVVIGCLLHSIANLILSYTGLLSYIHFFNISSKYSVIQNSALVIDG